MKELEEGKLSFLLIDMTSREMAFYAGNLNCCYSNEVGEQKEKAKKMLSKAGKAKTPLQTCPYIYVSSIFHFCISLWTYLQTFEKYMSILLYCFIILSILQTWLIYSRMEVGLYRRCPKNDHSLSHIMGHFFYLSIIYILI